MEYIFSLWLSVLLIANYLKVSYQTRASVSNFYHLKIYRPSVDCPTAVHTGRLTVLGTRPQCSHNFYRRKQCSTLFCFCVDRLTGELYDATVTAKSTNISCNPVSFLVTLTLESNPREPIDSNLVLQNLRRVTKSIPGNVTLIQLSNRFVQYDYLQTSIQLTAVGIPTSYEHQILQILLGNIDRGFIGDLKILRHFSTVVLLNPFIKSTMKIETLDNSENFVMFAGSNSETGTTPENKPLFSQPGIITAIVGGGLAALAFFILLILFCIYRLRKKDEGSYALDEPKKAPIGNAYSRAPAREFYA